MSSSDISQKPAHGKLKRLNISTYEYTAKADIRKRYFFAIKATGQGPTASGTSVITVERDDQIAFLASIAELGERISRCAASAR